MQRGGRRARFVGSFLGSRQSRYDARLSWLLESWEAHGEAALGTDRRFGLYERIEGGVLVVG